MSIINERSYKSLRGGTSEVWSFVLEVPQVVSSTPLFNGRAVGSLESHSCSGAGRRLTCSSRTPTSLWYRR